MTNVSLLLCCTILSFGIVVNGSTYINGEEVGFYEIKTGNFSVKLTNWGASLVSVVVPDKYGNLADVILGYDSVKDYMNDTQYFGAIVGRVANRISGASFTLDGIVYQLDNNEKNKTLHGGKHGFNKVVWKVQNHVKDGPSPSITFSYYSPDGDQGFPGDLLVNVTYALTGPYKLEVNMEAKALNKPTPVNLALHAYWNLGGHNSGDILSHKVKIFASHLTPTVRSIPTGQILPVKGTPYDFLQPHTITSVMNDNTLHALFIYKLKELIPDNGYDVNYVLDGGVDDKMKEAAVVCDEKSGRVLELWTSAPGMQFYTGNYVKNLKGKGDFVYGEHAGLALETQGFPDAVHHPNFPSQIVGPGEVYRHKMVYTFSTN